MRDQVAKHRLQALESGMPGEASATVRGRTVIRPLPENRAPQDGDAGWPGSVLQTSP